MHLYNGTGCLVFLIGNLSAMPITLKKNSNAVIIVSRQRFCFENTTDKIEDYRVVLNQEDTFRIMQFGFPGMTISIRGDLRTSKKPEIIAEKIEFIDFNPDNQFDQMNQNGINANFDTAEKSYWFSNEGDLRKELTYIH